MDPAGSAFVYHGSAAGLSLTSFGIQNVNQFVSEFGYSVSSAGDMVNGDSYFDVIIPVPDYTTTDKQR